MPAGAWQGAEADTPQATTMIGSRMHFLPLPERSVANALVAARCISLARCDYKGTQGPRYNKG